MPWPWEYEEVCAQHLDPLATCSGSAGGLLARAASSGAACARQGRLGWWRAGWGSRQLHSCGSGWKILAWQGPAMHAAQGLAHLPPGPRVHHWLLVGFLVPCGERGPIGELSWCRGDGGAWLVCVSPAWGSSCSWSIPGHEQGAALAVYHQAHAIVPSQPP